MSEYYLADKRADERARRRMEELAKRQEPTQSSDVKITLLGDFLFPTDEPQGFDPYNSVHGKPAVDVWRRNRR